LGTLVSNYLLNSDHSPFSFFFSLLLYLQHFVIHSFTPKVQLPSFRLFCLLVLGHHTLFFVISTTRLNYTEQVSLQLRYSAGSRISADSREGIDTHGWPDYNNIHTPFALISALPL